MIVGPGQASSSVYDVPTGTRSRGTHSDKDHRACALMGGISEDGTSAVTGASDGQSERDGTDAIR
jgi:hypothetical protein